MTENQRLYPAPVLGKQRSRSKAMRIATDGEEMAAAFLELRGYSVLLRNFRAGRSGEIDIIALSPEQIIVFVEVKTRRLEAEPYGIPEIGFEAVGFRKQRRIMNAAQAYLSAKDYAFGRWRYDVIVINIYEKASAASASGQPQIIHVRNAFF